MVKIEKLESDRLKAKAEKELKDKEIAIERALQKEREAAEYLKKNGQKIIDQYFLELRKKNLFHKIQRA